MARKARRLTFVVTPAAPRDLRGIWDYNADAYGPEHADRYIAFLDGATRKLEVSYASGKTMVERPGFQFMTLRKVRGAGHIAIYRVVDEAVEILRYQHTAQDWRGKAQRGEL